MMERIEETLVEAVVLAVGFGAQFALACVIVGVLRVLEALGI